MPEYLRALYERFKREVPEIKGQEEEAAQVYEKLHAQLEKPERRLLLELINLEDCLQENAALYGFIEGCRLAWGIHRELDEVPPYSFDRDQAQRAAVLLRAERRLELEQEKS